MKAIDLKANLRDKVGKGSARFARRNNLIPAVIYGNKEKPIPISLEKKEWYFLLQKPGIFGQLMNIETKDGKHFVLPRDIQFHPVTEDTLHIDFLRVTDSSYVNVGINVEFINEDRCNGIKFGGVLNVVRSQVELNCPATSIPEKITVDLEGLDVGDTIHISSISLPENCTPTITDRDFTVATIAAPRGGMSDTEDDETSEEQPTEEAEEKTEDKKEE